MHAGDAQEAAWMAIPLTGALVVAAAAGRGINERSPKSCNSYTSLCQQTPGATELYSQQINHFGVALAFAFVSAIVGPALSGCCKCNGLRCCACCSNIFSVCSLISFIALIVLFLYALANVVILIIVMLICQCPSFLAPAVRDPLITSANGKSLSLELDNPLDQSNLKELCQDWNGENINELNTSTFCIIPTQVRSSCRSFTSGFIGLLPLCRAVRPFAGCND